MQRLRRLLPPAPLAGLQRHCFAGVVGFAGGATLGLVGWGGGQMIIPGMTHQYMALNQLAATGVSLFSLSLSSISSSVRFATSDSACLVTAASIAIPSIVTARFGTQLASRLSNDALEFAFNSLSLARPLDVAFGCLSGGVSALMGVGGLPFTMSYLTACTDLPHHLVQGTAQCACAPSALTSAVSRIHAVPLGTAAAVAAGGVAGATAGATAALHLSEERLRELFMLSLLVLGGSACRRAVINLQSMYRKRT
ncbi:hypothetical protein EMIHUDRAFT_245049 [Emiliania huxleyi CCMP1516]|uniref:Uncharacterized protein n=2 Tax=Emiliania huxleyi TaxID=2903 RepID=A0A0D3IZ18_EMIH1|nr:hypothetical protein EMIHUDRAFT_245049 [Emiliania huxleyi CCMP1516]EOD16503.1 hypothetical protein EMIHUDRAFT_245049 [Emiliania huxleyi CCMP1516]|eukprot:XP_005768932.1 hypothetical protein EMIHUDRAFT_245049 [Emiliania huxleyi CCMP1516]